MAAPLKILIEGWFEIPHSYAMVACFQLVSFLRRKDVDVFIRETEYFRPHWNATKKLVYPEAYNEIVRGAKRHNGERVDVVYRLSYPYDISVPPQFLNTPIVVFHTAEFGKVDFQYFQFDKLTTARIVDDSTIQDYIATHQNVYFTSPSTWSEHGLSLYLSPEENTRRNKVITHGVDTSIFKRDATNRANIRQKYKVLDTDTLFINIGSMTKNKGIMEILVAMHLLVNVNNKTDMKLLLKGTGDLYQSRKFLEIYFEELQKQKVMSANDVKTLLQGGHIIFTETTIGYKTLNDLYNAADVYVSPYLAEGFNLTVLEAIAVGMPVVVSADGSTQFFIDDIMQNVPRSAQHIRTVPTTRRNMDGTKTTLQVDCGRVAQAMIDAALQRTEYTSAEYTKLVDFLRQKYGWDRVVDMLVDYFRSIV